MRLLPLTTLLPLAVVGSFGAMWHYTNELNQGAFQPDTSAPPPNVRIIEVLEGQIRLGPLEGTSGVPWNADGQYGLEWPGGYARVGRIIDLQADQALRELTVLEEVPSAAIDARIDSFVYRGDPYSTHGIGFEDVTVTGPAGEGPAWFIPGEGSTWAIFVHGKGASREEVLRLLPSLHELRLPTLVITYRNDADYSPISEGRYTYGENEWEDVAAAMDFARQWGAERFVLAGYSMGGGIVMATLQQPEYAELVQAAVLDSPMLSLKRTVQFRASERGIPGFYTTASLQFATWRNDIDWARTDYLSRASELTTPLLIIHGDADPSVPVKTSDELATARPDIVTYRRLTGVGHVLGWNADPDAYRQYVLDFLQPILAP